MLQCATNAGKKEENLYENNYGGSNKSNNLKRILGIFFLSLGVFFCTLFIYFSSAVTLINDNLKVELGTAKEISLSKENFFKGSDFALSLITPSGFDKDNLKIPGDYYLGFKYLYKEYFVKITVSDTKAPVINFNNDKFIAKENELINTLYFVDSVIDESSYKLSYLNSDKDESIIVSDEGITFTESGVKKITLRAVDTYDNAADYNLSVIVDSVPKIIGIKEYYVALGSSVDLLKGVTAFDKEDEDVSDTLTINKDISKITDAGDFTVKYTATDSYGIEGSAEGLVHVYDALTIQDLVNTGVLDSDDDNISGVINPYDCGYLIEGDEETAVEMLKPAIVRISYENSGKRANGSGYILKISEDEIIVCTNKHVVGSQNVVNVTLHDGTVVSGKVKAAKKVPDIGFIVVDTKAVKAELLSTLKTVHINLNYFEALNNNPQLGLSMYCINADGSKWLTHYGKIVRKSGVLDEYFADFDYPVTEVSVKLKPGVSGSAIFDEHCNLICMAAFYWTNNGVNENYGVSLDDILEYYEEVFKEPLQYY